MLETWGAGPYVLRNLAITGGSAVSSPAMLGGSAAASAPTVNTQPWVTPASASSAVKLSSEPASSSCG